MEDSGGIWLPSATKYSRVHRPRERDAAFRAPEAGVDAERGAGLEHG